VREQHARYFGRRPKEQRKLEQIALVDSEPQLIEMRKHCPNESAARLGERDDDRVRFLEPCGIAKVPLQA
jgi:hypothetical protein